MSGPRFLDCQHTSFPVKVASSRAERVGFEPTLATEVAPDLAPVANTGPETLPLRRAGPRDERRCARNRTRARRSGRAALRAVPSCDSQGSILRRRLFLTSVRHNRPWRESNLERSIGTKQLHDSHRPAGENTCGGLCRGYQPCIGLVTTARGGSRVCRPRLRRTRVGVEPTTTVAHVDARPCQVPRPRGVIGSLRISHGVHCLHCVGCSVVSGRQACVLSFAHLDGAGRNRTTVSRPLPDSTLSHLLTVLTAVRTVRRGEQESNQGLSTPP